MTWFQQYKFTILAAALLLFALAACAFTGQYQVSPPTDTQPAIYQKLTADQLDQLIADMQANFDRRAAEILAFGRAAATLPASQRAEALAATQAASDQLASEIDAFNAKVEVVARQIAAKKAAARTWLDVLGGLARAAGSAANDPSVYVNAGVSAAALLLGLGAGVDSHRKSKAIKRLAQASPNSTPAAPLP